MPDTSTLGLFVVASLALLIIPGPAVIYIVARGIHQGRSAALVSTLGIEVGTLIHLVAATLGLSVIVASSDLGFSVVKFAGAIYLVGLGIHTLLMRNTTLAVEGKRAQASMRRVFLQGVVVEVLNPKTALFLLAFLPQFADPERGSTAWQILILGLFFVVLAIFNDGLFALLSGTLGRWLRGNIRFLACQHYVCGGVYITLAVTTAMASPGLH